MLTDEQLELQRVAARLGREGLADSRAVVHGNEGPREPTHTLLSDFAGLGLGEPQGGVGGTLVDVVLVAEQLARTLSPTAWFSHIIAMHLAARAGLPVLGAAAGQERWSFARADQAGPRASELRASSIIRAVPDGAWASHVVVYDTDHVAVVPVSGARTVSAIDLTRPVADVTVTASPDNLAGAPWDLLVPALVVTAGELVGVARGAVSLGAGYARMREQFGVQIGRFQAVAHQLASAWLGAERAWSLTLHAAILEAGPEAARAAAAANAQAAEAAMFAAERALQVHGGLGMTWEADPHLFLRRALTRGNAFGTPDEHFRAVAATLIGVPGAS